MSDALRSVKFTSGHVLTTWDACTRAQHGQHQLRYEFRAPDDSVLFEGADYGVSPMHGIDSDAALLGLLAFLTLRPGDTDVNYFDDYTGEQYTWTQSGECESLSCDVSIAENEGADGCVCVLWTNLPDEDGHVWTCEDAPTVSDFEVLDHGEDGSQYFPGCGITDSRFDHVATGVGDTAAEALSDALESMATGEPSATVSPLQEHWMRSSLSDPDKSAFESLDHSECGDPDESEHDWNHYVSVRYNVRTPGEEA